jgi:hypothetical protein
MNAERDFFGNIPSGNEMVFDLYVNVNPEGNVPFNDTLWLMLDMETDLLTEKISGQGVSIPLNEVKLKCQFAIKDLLFPDTPIDYNLIVKKGSLKNKKDDIISIEFGYPQTRPSMLVGIHFKEFGRYSINFINYPNPQVASQLSEPCKENCDFSWYDMNFYLTPDKKGFVYQAIVDYHFSLSKRTENFDASTYLSNSIYNDAVYTFTVR